MSDINSAAAEPSRPDPSAVNTELVKLFVADSASPSDKEFLDDLSAAKEFKAYLIRNGHEVPERTVKGINDLLFVFAPDLSKYESDRAVNPPQNGSTHWPAYEWVRNLFRPRQSV
jgi:hypothetical protein